MTLKELNEWCEANSIPPETPLTFDRGIDLIEDVDHVIHNGMDLVLLGKGYDDEVITS